MPMDFRHGPVSGRDNYRFTCGDCHILALRLHRLTGWELATFADANGHPIMHAFVIHPDGDAVDVDGKRDIEAFRSGWGGYRIKTWTIPEFRKSSWWGGTAFGHYSYARARVVAGKILADLGVKV